jgi:hypothetical protein
MDLNTHETTQRTQKLTHQQLTPLPAPRSNPRRAGINRSKLNVFSGRSYHQNQRRPMYCRLDYQSNAVRSHAKTEHLPSLH